MIRPYRTRRIISIVVVISIWCLLSDSVRHEDVRFWSVDSMHILPSSTITATTTTAVTMTTTNDPPHRAMQEVDDTYFAYNDLSKYSIKYEKCQFVKMYDDELAALQQQQQGQSSSVSPLATRHFVVYRLCPSDTCGSTTGSASSSSNVCGSTDPTAVYGTYTMTVHEYLYYTVAYQKQVLEQSCNFCNAYCLSSSASSSSSSSTSPYCTTDCTNSLCRTCSMTCDAYQSFTTAMANGATNLADAADYITCQKLNNDGDAANNNNENADDDAVQYYIGPYCHQSVATSTETAPTYISIGLFSDEYCYSPVTNVNMTQLLGGVTLSYHLFQHTNTASTSSSSSKNKNTNNPMQCLSCFESNQNYNNQNDVNDVDDVNEMCENLYTTSAKCESTTGLSDGFIQMNGGNNNNNNDDENNHQYPNNNNQVENEFMVCTFIQSLLYNSYTETGVINLKVSQDYIVRVTTERQRTALILILLTILGLVGTIHYYHRRLQGLLLLPQSSTTTTTTTGPSLRNNPNVLLMPQGEMS